MHQQCRPLDFSQLLFRKEQWQFGGLRILQSLIGEDLFPFYSFIKSLLYYVGCSGPMLGIGNSMVRKNCQGPRFQGTCNLVGETDMNPVMALVNGQLQAPVLVKTYK